MTNQSTAGSGPYNWLTQFKKIAAVPHGSHNTAGIAAMLKEYAESCGCKTLMDHGNLIVTVPASPGQEDIAPVIIQGHMDMVCEKTAGSTHDFLKDPLDLKISEDGEWLYAQDTTLGGDDGVAVAYMMELMANKSLVHPKIYCVITREEEVGMLGAIALNTDSIKDAVYLLNIDSEDEGIFTLGCAGGTSVSARFPMRRKRQEGRAYTLSVSGITGGHSGMAIANYGAHAARILAYLLSRVNEVLHVVGKTIMLESFQADGRDNVITKAATATFIIPDHAEHTSTADASGDELDSDNPEQVLSLFTPYINDLTSVYAETDPDMKIALTAEGGYDDHALFTAGSTRSILFIIAQCPYGVLISGEKTPLMSLNIGRCATTDNVLELMLGLRGNSPQLISVLRAHVRQFIEGSGGKILTEDSYPSWPEKKDAELTHIMKDVYEEQYGKQPVTDVIHAGLECGVFAEKLPHLELVSFGPDLKDIHTPQEKLNIPSAERVFEFLLRSLEKMSAPNGDKQAAQDPQDSPAVLTRSDGTPVKLSAIRHKQDETKPNCSACEAPNCEDRDDQ